MKKGFTIMELLVIMVIISVLATLAMPAYMRSMEMTFDNQAKSDLKLLSNAQKSYYVDMNAYYVPSNSTQPGINRELNNVLGLALSGGTDRKWNFTTDVSGCCEATRTAADSRSWYMAVNDTEASSGTCP
jgi:prepilin-type N-terminal cleavage/methylation domain-containing protein